MYFAFIIPEKWSNKLCLIWQKCFGLDYCEIQPWCQAYFNKNRTPRM